MVGNGDFLTLILQAYVDWQNNPVLTSVQTTGLPISEIDFPAINRFDQDEDHKVLVKVYDVCCRHNTGWVRMRNLVPAGLSHSEDE